MREKFYIINICKNIEKTKLKVYILCMGCKSCKEKSLERQAVEAQSARESKAGIWVILIWSALGIYGLISLISDLIRWL